MLAQARSPYNEKLCRPHHQSLIRTKNLSVNYSKNFLSAAGRLLNCNINVWAVENRPGELKQELTSSLKEGSPAKMGRSPVVSKLDPLDKLRYMAG